MRTTYSIEQYAPYSIDDLETAPRTLVEPVMSVVEEQAGKAISKFQRRRPHFVGVHIIGKSLIEDDEEHTTRYIDISADVIDPTRPFAFKLALTDVIKMQGAQAPELVSETGAIAQSEIDRRFRLQFADNEVIAPHNPAQALPGVEIKYFGSLIKDSIKNNEYFKVRVVQGSQKRFSVPRHLPVAGTVAGELTRFAGKGGGQAHQATFNNHLQNEQTLSGV